MKKALTILFILASALILCDVTNMGEAVAMFFLAGVIPGFNVSLDAHSLLVAYAFLAGLVCQRVAFVAIAAVRTFSSTATIAKA